MAAQHAARTAQAARKARAGHELMASAKDNVNDSDMPTDILKTRNKGAQGLSKLLADFLKDPLPTLFSSRGALQDIEQRFHARQSLPPLRPLLRGHARARVAVSVRTVKTRAPQVHQCDLCRGDAKAEGGGNRGQSRRDSNNARLGWRYLCTWRPARERALRACATVLACARVSACRTAGRQCA